MTDFLCFRVIPESLRWLIAKGKFTEAEILIDKINSYNGSCGLKKIINETADVEGPPTPENSQIICNDLKGSKNEVSELEEKKTLLQPPESNRIK